LTFSFILYLIIFLFITRVFNKKRDKYKDKELLTKDVEDLEKMIKSFMVTESPYKNANLTMPDLAKKLRISPQKLSQFLNDNLERSFSIFINEYRIELAKRTLLSDKRITMESLSEICGYNSTSTFYSTFKKHTGTTPANFRKLNIVIRS
jgi:AraC-like DNA-binding protein